MEGEPQNPTVSHQSPLMVAVMQLILFSAIRFDPERYANRESHELTDESVRDLREDIAGKRTYDFKVRGKKQDGPTLSSAGKTGNLVSCKHRSRSAALIGQKVQRSGVGGSILIG